MQGHRKLIRLLTYIAITCLASVAKAGNPVWTFTPLTATTISVPTSSTATVQYQVTNQSSKTHTLSVSSISGITQLTTGLGVCGNPFVLLGYESCTLSLQVNGSELTGPVTDGPIVCEQGPTLLCYRPSPLNILHITPLDGVLLFSVSPPSGAASGGTGVTLSGQDFTGATSVTFGGVAATSVNVVDSSTATAVTPAHAVGAVDVTITTPNGSATLPNGYTYVTTAVGLPAFGGVIACLNGGLNNLIAAKNDGSPGIIWGSNAITTGATSITDGASNTAIIVGTPGETTPNASTVCENYEVDSQGHSPCEAGNTCYNNWFLPAGDNLTSSGQLNCLFDNQTSIGGFSITPYWSSTESSTTQAWSQGFSSGVQSLVEKNFVRRVRCVSAFTP